MRSVTKWDQFGTSIFSVMTLKAIQAGAVNLAQGFPDFDGPDVVKEAAIAAIRGTSFNQYAPAPGLPALRELLAAKQKERSGIAYSADTEVTVFSGATEAIYCAMQALLEAGDEIIAFEPTYDSYPAAAFAAGAKVVGVPLKAPDWTFDEEALRRAVTPRTKAIIVNSPHNPTGRVFTRAELQLIRDLVVEKDLFVITDEVYEALVYAPHQHVSLATLPGMAERTVVISSTSKTYSFTGWKVGYAFAPPQLTKALRAVHQFTVFCSATPLQVGMLAALKLDPSYYEDLNTDYRAKRDALCKILNDAGFKCRPPEGTYFVLADYSAHKDVDDVSFAGWLTETIKVAAIPISVFHTDSAAAARRLRYVRFAFCKGPETLAAAAANFRALRPHA